MNDPQGKFPSPTGVKYYEYKLIDRLDLDIKREFPSPTGVKYYEYCDYKRQYYLLTFPSPTGVKYYESLPTKP